MIGMGSGTLEDCLSKFGLRIADRAVYHRSLETCYDTLKLNLDFFKKVTGLSKIADTINYYFPLFIWDYVFKLRTVVSIFPPVFAYGYIVK